MTSIFQYGICCLPDVFKFLFIFWTWFVSPRDWVITLMDCPIAEFADFGFLIVDKSTMKQFDYLESEYHCIPIGKLCPLVIQPCERIAFAVGLWADSVLSIFVRRSFASSETKSQFPPDNRSLLLWSFLSTSSGGSFSVISNGVSPPSIVYSKHPSDHISLFSLYF